jgi:8-oxo-dGTP pyrophosphatase MutT (NUDIX family)
MQNVYIKPPKNISPSFKVAGCFLQWEDKILMVKRHPDDSYGNTWSIPSGTIEIPETPKMGVLREVFEEVGINIIPNLLEYMGELYMKKHNFIYHIFAFSCLNRPKVTLDFKEVVEAKWTTVEEALTLPLIEGAAEIFAYYQKKS